MPKIRGVSRMAADYLGVETNWPETGLGPWTPIPTPAPAAP
jgi:hypothetical protein